MLRSAHGEAVRPKRLKAPEPRDAREERRIRITLHNTLRVRLHPTPLVGFRVIKLDEVFSVLNDTAKRHQSSPQRSVVSSTAGRLS